MGDEKLIKTSSFSLKDKLKLIHSQQQQQQQPSIETSSRLLQPVSINSNKLSVNLSHSSGSVATTQSHDDGRQQRTIDDDERISMPDDDVDDDDDDEEDEDENDEDIEDDDLHNLNILCNDTRDLIAADIATSPCITNESNVPPHLPPPSHMKSICKS